MLIAAVAYRGSGDGAEQTLQDLQLGDAHIQFHLRGEGEAGTAPGTIPTGPKHAPTQPKPFFRWSDNPMERINMALKQGCEAMSPTSDIVTDANLGCQEDQVAFFHDEFGPNTAYWICYRCLLSFSTPAPVPPAPPTKPPVRLPESCFSAMVHNRAAVGHGTVMCTAPAPSGDCGKTSSGIPKRLFKGWKCCVC